VALTFMSPACGLPVALLVLGRGLLAAITIPLRDTHLIPRPCSAPPPANPWIPLCELCPPSSFLCVLGPKGPHHAPLADRQVAMCRRRAVATSHNLTSSICDWPRANGVPKSVFSRCAFATALGSEQGNNRGDRCAGHEPCAGWAPRRLWLVPFGPWPKITRGRTRS
jgi:hypothetical protein